MRTPINVTLTAAALCLLSTPALAGPSTDVGVDILTPASELVYDASAIDILVENTSNRRANDVVLSVSLPETNTSPTVHVMGSLSAVDPACVQTGTQLSCALGRLDAISVEADLGPAAIRHRLAGLHRGRGAAAVAG